MPLVGISCNMRGSLHFTICPSRERMHLFSGTLSIRHFKGAGKPEHCLRTRRHLKHLAQVLCKLSIPSCQTSSISIFRNVSGMFPQECKISHITPVFKASDPSTNYCPISLLFIISMILERPVHNSLMAHILEHDLLLTNQLGFRKASSIQQALLAVTQDWHLVLEEGSIEVCIFFDLSKAFDSLSQKQIMDSHARFGVCEYLYVWFGDYLRT